MSWLVRFMPDLNAATEPNPDDRGNLDTGVGDRVDDDGDLMDRYPAFVSLLWEFGSTGLFEQPSDGPDTPAVLVAGFAGRATADRAVVAGREWNLQGFAKPVTETWFNNEISTVTIGDHTFSVVAGPSFGHGAHPTTRLALDLISRLATLNSTTDHPLGRVLDLGTGSGVLAIAADRLGAESLTAIDIDPAAVNAANRNLTANSVSADCRTATVQDLVDEGDRFDTALVNVLVTVHESEAASVARLLEPGGCVVATGFLADQLPRVVACYQRGHAALQPIVTAQLEEWLGCVLADPAVFGQPPTSATEANG